MDFKDLLSVSGKSGLFELKKARPDGLIVSKLGDDSKTFLSSRKYNFTPLENIGVYQNNGETIELKSVFHSIHNQSENRPSSTDDAMELRAYFEVVLPDYDEEMVKVSDIKKMLQWYELMQKNNLTHLVSEASSEEEE